MPSDLTKPFDVAVVMFTKRTGPLAAAVRSVFTQQYPGRVQILVGVDGPQGDRAALETLAREVPPTMALTVVDPGYSTVRSRGGLYASEAGGSLRTALSFLANARRVAYLSETALYAPDHLDRLARAIGDNAWAHTERWFVDARSGQVICRDGFESVGPDRGIFAKSEGGFAAADTLLVDKFACHGALLAWTEANAQGHGAERRFFRAIRALPCASTGEPTVYAGVDLERQHPFMLAQFRASGVVLERLMTLTPEVKAEVDRILAAQRDVESGARGSLSVQGVDFDFRRDR